MGGGGGGGGGRTAGARAICFTRALQKVYSGEMTHPAQLEKFLPWAADHTLDHIKD